MSKARSPKKDGAPAFEADPEMKERARKAQSERSKKKQDLLDKYAYHIVFGLFGAVMIFALVSTLWKSGPDILITDVNDEEYIKALNSQGNSFTVGPVPHFDGYKLADVKRLINNQASNKQQLYRCNTGNKDTIVPESYSFREAYPQCARQIVSQGNCSSSYSIATTSAITDRLCRFNDLQFPILSAQSPLICDKFINTGCKGGFVSRTLDYAKLYGLVDEKCYGYNSTSEDTAEQCQEAQKSCERHKIGDYCVSSELQNIKQEIFNHGPVIVVIPVYRDFLIYKEGLYQVYPKNSKFSSGHAVKIIGWDVIDGKSCWLIENSWGPDWGKNGLGCILVNLQELQIERFTLAVALNSEVAEQKQEFEEAVEGDILDEPEAEEQEL